SRDSTFRPDATGPRQEFRDPTRPTTWRYPSGRQPARAVVLGRPASLAIVFARGSWRKIAAAVRRQGEGSAPGPTETESQSARRGPIREHSSRFAGGAPGCRHCGGLSPGVARGLRVGRRLLRDRQRGPAESRWLAPDLAAARRGAAVLSSDLHHLVVGISPL